MSRELHLKVVTIEAVSIPELNGDDEGKITVASGEKLYCFLAKLGPATDFHFSYL